MNDQTKNASGISIFLLEELGDARLRCAQLKKYIDEVLHLVEKSSNRDHLFEVGAHLIHGVPDTLMKLEKALNASALAASKLDYEEIKDDLRPEKVDELEKALEEVRIRRVQRRSKGKENVMNVSEAVAQLESFASQLETEGKLDVHKLAAFIGQLETGHKEASEEVSSLPQVLRSLSAGLVDPEEKPSRVALASMLRRVLATQVTAEDFVSKTATKREYKIFQEVPRRWVGTAFGEDEDEAIKNWLKSSTSPKAKKLTYEDLVAVPKMKTAATDDSDEKEARYEEGKPADPTKEMSPEDAKKWKNNTDKYEDKFKEASEDPWKARSKHHYAADDSDEKEARFEEGKPADPTKNMSPEDAKKWKTEHEKNKDKFKEASDWKVEAAQEELDSVKTASNENPWKA